MRKCAAVLCLLLALSACGAADGAETKEASLLGQAAGLEEEAVLLSVDGREVPAWRYLYWLAFTCDQVQARYREAGLKLDWTIPVTGGTLGDYAKDQALADTALYATVETWAEDSGQGLTEEEREALAELWAEESAARGGEGAYLAELAGLGLDRERAEELAEVGLLYAKLSRLYGTSEFTPPGAAEAEDEAAKTPSLTIDRILAAAGEDRDAARARIEALFSRLNGAADQEEAFPALAAEGDDHAGPRTFRPGDGTFDAALEDAALSLEPGQCSGILESPEGFSILRRLPEEAGETAEAGEKGPDAFDQLLQQAAERAMVKTSAAYGSLDAARFHRAMEALRRGAE